MGASLFTTVNMVVQFNAKLIGSVVETLVLEFDQQRYEEYLFFSSSGSKFARCYRRVTNKKYEALSPIDTNKTFLPVEKYEALSLTNKDKMSSFVDKHKA